MGGLQTSPGTARAPANSFRAPRKELAGAVPGKREGPGTEITVLLQKRSVPKMELYPNILLRTNISDLKSK